MSALYRHKPLHPATRSKRDPILPVIILLGVAFAGAGKIAMTNNAIHDYLSTTLETDRVTSCRREFDKSRCDAFAKLIVERTLTMAVHSCPDLDRALAAANAKNYRYILDACAPK